MRPWTFVATVPMRRGWRCGARALRRGWARRPRRGLCSVALPEPGCPAGQLRWRPRTCQPASWAQFAEPSWSAGSSKRGCSEYELSVGKIADTLQKDYPAIFEREPDFGLYQKHVLLELGQPFHVSKVVAYQRALSSLLRLGKACVRNGKVFCQVCDGKPYGHALRVHWTCVGQLGTKSAWTPLNISAVSLYSVDKEVPRADEDEARLAYKVSRHVIEFTEINPPSIRSLLQNLWWRAQVDQREPALALKPLPSLSAAASLPSDVELYSAGCSSAEDLRRPCCFGASPRCYTPPPPPTVICPATWSLFAS